MMKDEHSIESHMFAAFSFGKLILKKLLKNENYIYYFLNVFF